MQNKPYLYIDTTNNYCYVAIYHNDKLVKKAKLLVNKNVTDLIVPTIDKLFKDAKLNKLSLDKIYVNIGPGTFTGLKVGVLVAKAWALVNPEIAIYTCNSLLLQVTKLPAISVIDAKSKKLYLAVYDKTKTIIKPCLIDVDDLEKYTEKYPKFNLYKDETDNMYANFLNCKAKFRKIKSVDLLEPLYLKNPVQ